jgi:hypothetical protein
LAPLPVVAVCSRESAAAELSTLRARQHRTLTDPVSIGALATAINELGEVVSSDFDSKGRG